MTVKVDFKGIRPEQFAQQIEKAARYEVLVGIPSPHPKRLEIHKDEGKKRAFHGIWNADLAAIHENGAPARGIPARPFIRPGIERVKKRLIQIAANAGEAMAAGESLRPYAEQAGLEAQRSIRAVFRDNNWAPLRPRTMINRAYKRVKKRRDRRGQDTTDRQKMAKLVAKELAAMGAMRALIDTGQLRQAIDYVVVERGVR